MVDYAKTISVSINLFGVAPTNKWNEYNWAAFKWGEGTNGLPKVVGKAISETIVATNTIAVAAGFNRTISVTVSVGSEMVDEYVIDTSGYYHVFPDRVTDSENRSYTSWAAQAQQSTTWTSSTASSTSWG